jgi:hypothetical protein
MKTLGQILNESIVSDHKSLSKHYTFKDVPHHLKTAVQQYTDDSADLNSYHWNKHELNQTGQGHLFDPDSRGEYDTKRLDNALEHHRTPHDVTVYAGIKGDPRERANKEGVVHHPAYMSTSLNKRIAQGFANSNRHADKNEVNVDHAHTLQITVPKGHAGAYVGNKGISDAPKEKEFILPRGLNFKLTGHSQKEQPSIIYPNKKIIHHTHTAEIL